MLVHLRAHSKSKQRGVILIVVVAMLALFSTIGILAAIVSKNEAAGAGNFKKAEQNPTLAGQGVRTLARGGTFDAQGLLAEAMSQLIFDTSNEQSVIRGHSLLRNMYGGPITSQTPSRGAELRPQANSGFPYYGAFNGPGHYAPRDYPSGSYPAGADPLPGVQFAAPSGTGILAPTEVAYGLFRLRPPGNAANWQTLWNVPNNGFLRPHLPFNHAIFDALGTRLATAPVGGRNQAPEEFFDGANWHYFAKDVDYTAADHNNWFLALERADGQIIQPSFHRPHLVAQLEAAGVFDYRLDVAQAAGTAVGTAANGSKAWNHPEGRRVIFRPMARDVSVEATTGVAYTTPPNKQLGQSWANLSNRDKSTLPNFPNVPVIGDSPEELDVDTDGDGLKDAIWVDLGLPANIRLPDGGFAKPLFAYKVLSLDGKINMNVAGNYRFALDENGTLGTLANRPRHSSHLGASPTEINPKHAFLLSETSTGAADPRIPNWHEPGFYAWLLFGRIDSGNPLYGRWNDPAAAANGLDGPRANPLVDVLPTRVGAGDGIAVGPGLVTANANVDELPAGITTTTENTTLRTSVLQWGAYDPYGFGASYEPFGARGNTMFAATTTAFKDVLGLSVNSPTFGVKSQIPLGAPAPTQPALTDNDLKLESALQSIPYDDTTTDRLSAQELAVRTKDTPFTAPQLERLLRYFDIDGSIQSTRVTELLREAMDSRSSDTNPAAAGYVERQYARNRMRRMFTHSSWDLIHMGTPPTFPESTIVPSPGNPQMAPEDSSKQDATLSAPYRHNGRIGVRGNAFPAGATFPTTMVTGANEGFGNTSNGNFGTRLPIEVRHGRRYNLTRVLDVYPAATADGQRTDMAEQVYMLLWLAVRPADRLAGGFADPTYKALNRTLAQLAVNIVDYIDPDDVMTRMVFPEQPFGTPGAANAWPISGPLNAVPNNENVVFGFELPRVVISEAVAVRAGRPSAMPTDDRLWLFAELHNPWPRDANGASNLDAQLATGPSGTSIYMLKVNDNVGGVTGQCGFLLSDTPHTAMGAPVGQVVGTKGSANNYFIVGPSTDRNPMDPDDPAEILSGYVGPVPDTSNGTINSTSIQFAANCMYHANVATSSTREITFTLFRLRNPNAVASADNPMVAIDLATCKESTNEGLYLANGAGMIAVDQRFSRARKQPWHGDSLEQATLTANAPYRLVAAGGSDEARMLGVPLATVPTDSGFANSATAGMTANTLGADNADVNVNEIYTSFPFANRPLASPLELLSVRLYGSHFWPTAPTGEPMGEWRMRFTDDYQFYSVTSTTPSGTPLQRVWRSRQTPWLLDAELGSTRPHPESAAPHQQVLMPNLHRFFEFVECRSLLNGSIDPDADEALASNRFPNSLGNSAAPRIDPRRSRVAGKICLNTITDEEAFRALVDAPEAMPGTAVPANFDTQGDLPTPAWHPINYALDPFRRIYAGELVRSQLALTAPNGPIIFGGDTSAGLTILTNAAFNNARRQWGPSLTAGLRAACTYPGRHQDDLVGGELYRMFLLSRAGRDGILGTGDDKPFRGFAVDHLSDTILRRRNFRYLDNPQVDRSSAVTYVDGLNAAQTDEYIVEPFHGQYVPRLFDPIGNPYNRPNAAGGAVDPTDATQARIDHKIELDTKFNFTATTPFPGAANDQLDYWMLEGRRNRLLGKIAGNSTTRSNVFAVWVTVGLFRVQAGTESNLVPLLNEEVGSNTGEQVRHRGFFIVDRTRLDHYDASQIKSHSLDDDDMKKAIQHYTIIE